MLLKPQNVKRKTFAITSSLCRLFFNKRNFRGAKSFSGV